MGKMRKLRTVATALLLVSLLAFAVSVSMATVAGADTMYPCAYMGHVFVDDAPVPAGTTVRAIQDSTTLEQTTTGLWNADNYYYIDVVAVPGSTVYFQIWDAGEGEWADAIENATHVQFGGVEVDLHAWSGAPVTPTPTATPTSTATVTPTPTGSPTITPTPTVTPTPIVGTSVAIGCASASVNGSVETEITIATDEAEGIGSATITLTVDTAVVSFGGVDAGDLGEVIWDTANGTITMTAATGDSPGPTGAVTFGTVTLNAVGSSGDCSDLDITVTSLNDGTAGDPQPITLDKVNDCTFCIETPVTPTPTPSPGGGLSGGAVAGIVVGSLIAGALVMWLIMRRGGSF